MSDTKLLAGETCNQQSRYWYTHKLLERFYHTIKKFVLNMFHYLNNPKIPKTANGIEGLFSYLENHFELHGGINLPTPS